jgi:hypothetical protein
MDLRIFNVKKKRMNPQLLVAAFSFLLMNATLFAQHHENSHAHGVTCPAEFEIKRCPFDTTAQVVVLFDVAEAKINEFDYQRLHFKTKMRFKILKKEGITSLPDFRIMLERTAKPVVKAMTINMVDGEIKQYTVPESSILRQAYDKRYDEIVILFPNVEEGSILDLAYSYDDRSRSEIPSWTFQSRFPVYWSE